MALLQRHRARRKLVGQKLLYAISVFASLGVFLFGYDQGVMSGVITGPHFMEFFETPTAIEVGTMVAVLEIGAFITSIAAGRVGDIIGRRRTLFSGAVLFTIGGIVQTFTVGFKSMVVGRFISGFGVGLLSTIVPIYQSEISPPNHRGALACAEFTGNIVGYSFSVWTDYFCSFINSNLSWRIPLFIQCVIGAILAMGSLLMPESPRWLIDHDKDEEGMKVIADLHGDDLDGTIAKAEFNEIKDKVIRERSSGEGRSYRIMWMKCRRRVLLAMSSQAFAQLNGINVISYYAPRVFEEAGWIGRQAILMTGINSIIYVISTLPPWYLVDRWGRRPILLSGAIIMAFALGATGYFMYLNRSWTPDAVVLSVIVFNAAFGYSWGPLPWLYPPEIMPLTFRAKGVSLSTATNWLFNWIIGQTTPYLQDVITWHLYFMHAFFCLCSFVLVFFLYPETKGVPLEEMDIVFGEDGEKEGGGSLPTPPADLFHSPHHISPSAASTFPSSPLLSSQSKRGQPKPKPFLSSSSSSSAREAKGGGGGGGGGRSGGRSAWGLGMTSLFSRVRLGKGRRVRDDEESYTPLRPRDDDVDDERELGAAGEGGEEEFEMLSRDDDDEEEEEGEGDHNFVLEDHEEDEEEGGDDEYDGHPLGGHPSARPSRTSLELRPRR